MLLISKIIVKNPAGRFFYRNFSTEFIEPTYFISNIKLYNSFFPNNIDNEFLYFILFDKFFINSSFISFFYIYYLLSYFLQTEFDNFRFLDLLFVNHIKIFNFGNEIMNPFIFFSYKKLFLISYNDFILKVDFFLFMFFNDFLEYFRLVKYNSYLFYHPFATPGSELIKFLMQPFPNFPWVKANLGAKKNLFFSYFYIYKIFFSIKSKNFPLWSESFFPYSLHKFFFLLVCLKSFSSIFLKTFISYIYSSFIYFSYLSTLIVPYFSLFYLHESKKLYGFYYQVNYFMRRAKFSWLDPHLYICYKKLFNSFIYESELNISIFNNLNIMEVKDIMSYLDQKLYYHIYQILILDYIDNLFFDIYLEMYSMNYFRLYSKIFFFVSNSYLSFIELYSNFFSYFNIFINNFKLTLDFLLWDIFNIQADVFSYILLDNSMKDIYYINDYYNNKILDAISFYSEYILNSFFCLPGINRKNSKLLFLTYFFFVDLTKKFIFYIYIFNFFYFLSLNKWWKNQILNLFFIIYFRMSSFVSHGYFFRSVFNRFNDNKVFIFYLD